MAWRGLLDQQTHDWLTSPPPIGDWKEFHEIHAIYREFGRLPTKLTMHPDVLKFWNTNYSVDVNGNILFGIPVVTDETQPKLTTWADVFEASQPPKVDVVPAEQPVPVSSIFTALLEAWKNGTTLPLDSASRKLIPIHSGVNEYFPAALAAVAAQSKYNNEKHSPGQKLGWPQDKSMDQADCFMRHLFDQGDAEVMSDELKEFIELTAQCWRKLAELQLLAQKHGAPKPPAAR